ncbi:flavin reductase family protein [Nocardia brasiliensis]
MSSTDSQFRQNDEISSQPRGREHTVLRICDLSDDLADPRVLRNAYGAFPSGVVAVSQLWGGEPVGLAVSSFVSVSIDPPLVSICVRNESRTWPQGYTGSRVGVSVLAGHQHVLGRNLAGPAEQRFAGVRWHAAESGAVFLAEATAWLECEIEQEVPAGDHRIVVLGVRALAVDTGAEPLVFHASGFRSLR